MPLVLSHKKAETQFRKCLIALRIILVLSKKRQKIPLRLF
jgi:hypothetical protein